MEHIVDYRLLERFAASRRRNRRPDQTCDWLERLRARRELEDDPTPMPDAWRRVRVLDLRD